MPAESKFLLENVEHNQEARCLAEDSAWVSLLQNAVSPNVGLNYVIKNCLMIGQALDRTLVKKGGHMSEIEIMKAAHRRYYDRYLADMNLAGAVGVVT